MDITETPPPHLTPTTHTCLMARIFVVTAKAKIVLYSQSHNASDFIHVYLMLILYILIVHQNQLGSNKVRPMLIICRSHFP